MMRFQYGSVELCSPRGEGPAGVPRQPLESVNSDGGPGRNVYTVDSRYYKSEKSHSQHGCGLSQNHNDDLANEMSELAHRFE